MTEKYKPIFLDRTASYVHLEASPTSVSTDLQKAVDLALSTIQGRSFSERNPELGKMIKCQICGTRHRQNERKCEQRFTYNIGDYEYFREDEKGDLVPDYRTAVPVDSKPTMRQVMGQAAFTKKRFRPHPSKIKLQFIERVRAVYGQLKFVWNLSGTPSASASKLQRARIIAARQLRRERELSDREIRRRQDQSRRINRGLL